MFLQELEAILGREKQDSGRTSPTSSEEGTTPGTKSQATSCSIPGEEEEEDTVEKDEEGIVSLIFKMLTLT